MSVLPPIWRKHRICVICEGYEDYHYFNRLIALNLWDDSYSFTTINAKSSSNIPARFQNEYQSDRYEIILYSVIQTRGHTGNILLSRTKSTVSLVSGKPRKNSLSSPIPVPCRLICSTLAIYR